MFLIPFCGEAAEAEVGDLAWVTGLRGTRVGI